jgi:glycosyltransferase involved in cell wall biosynthesis
MKILVVLTYYLPHISGLTIYAERLSKALVKRGHQVTVLTSQFDKSLPREETIDGVRIVRAPVLFRISKGVIMPSFGRLANRLAIRTDVIHLHLPQFDAAGVALRGMILRKPTVITYHCDLKMPKGIFSYIANQAIHTMNYFAALFTHRVVTYTRDYAIHSKFLSRFMHKIEIINPPVELPIISQKEIANFKKENNPKNNHPVIGIAARFASEKGVEILLRALEVVVEKFPYAQVWFAGPYKNILGEQEYFDRLIPEIRKFEQSGNWKFLDLLSPQEMAAFYPNLDLLTIPSLNSTEAFGLVQIEAMMYGKPSIASDLPGVRQPVKRHKLGKVFAIGDSDALAEAIIEVFEQKEHGTDNSEFIQSQYLSDVVASEFESLYKKIFNELKKQTPTN